MKKTKYYTQARLFPSILTAIPLLIFVNGIVASLYAEALQEIFSILPLISNIGLSAALIFLMVQLNRFVAKEVFQHFYFQDEINMPTTNYLLWSDDFFDDTVKKLIRDKIKSKFNLVLMDKIDEMENESKSRKQIVTAVSQIRNSLRNNKLLLQHNIEYGFIRNLFGGCLFAILFSIVIIIYGAYNQEISLKIVGIIMFVIYSTPLLFSKFILKNFGKYYSKTLYEQFLSI